MMSNENCDDAYTNMNIGCTDDCTSILPGFNCVNGSKTTLRICNTTCGDGILVLKVGNETCDDGNILASDGCSTTCTIEPNWTCTQNVYQKSVCTPICKDGLNMIASECDVGQTALGCLDNCTAPHPCYTCSGGSTTSP